MSYFKQDFTEISIKSMKLETSEAISQIPVKGTPMVNFAGVVKKLNEDTSAEAEQWFREGRKVLLLVVFWNMFQQFITVYFVKGSWRYGYTGFMSAVNSLLYPLISYAKYWELKERERGRM